MRLFLSSQDFGKYGKKAAEMAGSNKRAAYFKNAQDFKSPDERNWSTPDKKKMFMDAGFEHFEEIDLRDYFGNKDKLLSKLSDFGSAWFAGGNTFILRRAMQASGFDEIIINLLKNDKIMYGGWSAGAMILSPDLRGPIWSEEDRPDIVPDGYNATSISQGLNIVPFYLVPHFGSEIHGESPQELAGYYKSKNLQHYNLADGQVIVIDNDKEQFLK